MQRRTGPFVFNACPFPGALIGRDVISIYRDIASEMRVVYLLLLLAPCVLTVGVKSAKASNDSALKTPAVTVDLRKIGWTPAPNESNRSFFKDFSVGKLESLDENTRTFFLSDEIVVAYHTKQNGKDWRTAPRQVEAFFIRAKDGSLLYTKTWPTKLRQSGDDLRDSEGRLFPLHDGRLLVVANEELSLYSADMELQKRQKLEPHEASDFWAVQSVAGGREIFLRHESRSDWRVKFLWLDADTLEVKHQLPTYPYQYTYQGFPMQGVVVADGGAIYAGVDSSIRMIDREQQFRTICDDQLCRLSFGETRSDMAGMRFGIWVTANKNAVFDSVKINAWPTVTILVYEVGSPKDHPLVVSTKSSNGLWDFTLSPDGSKLAVFDGVNVQVYIL
jgi:hypothetical protein